ncbi:phosphatidylinositol phosphatase PTPRQ [Periophthalmus magnuspinnatus]|uniref:phosphatidylinositol phosphatase PTPRQ n=1 Tax=Periophthalmus magnuspinnatus TaxID=409849 RepID=UPI00243726B7|nr:phosphatidylinositol phosphatase PTPRQ [Periophthalmus magnuspinnatus]
MGGTEQLLILASVCQVVWLTCERHSSPTEVEMAFHPFPNSQEADSYLITCRTATHHLVHEEPVDRLSCTPDCTLSFHIVEDSRGYRVTLTPRTNNSRTLAQRTFDFSPVPLSSFRLSSTTTSVSLAWSLPRQHLLSTLVLYDLDDGSVIRTVDINSTAGQSHYTVKDVQPGARVKAAVMVSAFLNYPSVTVKQRLSMVIQTAQCPPGWLPNRRHCYTVEKKPLAWSQARQSCSDRAAGSHLADLKTRQDLYFITSHLMSLNSLLLLWTALNDRLAEGRAVWSDGSLNNMTNSVMSSVLPENQSDCFALQRNATGPGYFLTPFFCSIPLPFICHYHIPPEVSSFSFDLVQVTEREVELQWSQPSALVSLTHSPLEIFLLYQQDQLRDNKKDREQSHMHSHRRMSKLVKVPIALFSSGVTVAGLFPGSVYSFSLQASHPTGFKWSLGQSRTAHTRPFPPLNVTVIDATVDQILVHWLLTDAHYVSDWSFVVHYKDMVLKQERIAGMANISGSFRSGGQHSFTAVIGGLEPYRNYSIDVYTVTKYGIKSCGQVPLLVHTAVRTPRGLVAETSADNLTVCWDTQHADPPDRYEVTSLSLHNARVTSTVVHPGRPEGLWETQSLCVSMGPFIPGQTYNIGVVAFKGNDRSQETTMLHTAKPVSVQVAVPLSVSATNVQLYVQPPQVGLMDGVKVCVCPKLCDPTCEDFICGLTCDWSALHANVHTVTINNLSPGSQVQFKVFSTSRNQTGPPYFTKQIRTSLAPPSRLREGVVTHSSIELLWDPAPGHAGSYEVICFNCEHTHMVQKVPGQRAKYSSLTPGTLYHFAVCTEKRLFPDSSPVNISITAAPSPVELSIGNKTTSSICISWATSRGVVSGFLLSIKNVTAKPINMHPEHRGHCFRGLTPGTKYTIEVMSLSGEQRGQPTVITLHTTPQTPQDVTLSEQGVTHVFVAWRPPPGLVDGYKVCFGLQFVNRTFWKHVYVQSPSYEISHLTAGSDYGLSVQSVLGSDLSSAVYRNFSTRPAGVCGLHLDYINSSSVSIRWDNAAGDFDFHRVTVANASVTSTWSTLKEEPVAMVAGLQDGCTYNLSVERVRGAHVGRAASLTVSTVPAPVREVCVQNVSSHAFSLLWPEAEGCVDHYQVTLRPDEGKVTVHPAQNGYIQAHVLSVTPSTQYNVTVSVAASSHISPGVSRMISTRNSVPSTPFGLEGHTSGTNGILLSWTMTDAKYTDFIIRYREVCPYPATDFTEETMFLDSPVVLLTELISGSTYQFQVAAVSSGISGAFSKSLYIKTAESPPGHVTNLTAFAQNHSHVVVTWYLPQRINGLITKFSVNVKHARNGMVVRRINVNAEEIMSIALPHCNDAAEILSRATVSPLEMTASSPPITLSAVPPAALWKVPISVGVDQLRPFTPYLFEVSAFTSEGEGKTGSVMVHMPESAPEDSPRNLTLLNMTSRFVVLSWISPRIVTGKFSYVLQLHGPTGYFLNGSTFDTNFEFSGLMPYTKYTVIVRAKSAGELGPAAERRLITAAEAPSAVQALTAEAEDSLSIRVSWKSPAQPNGPITQYRLQVLVQETLLQDITLTAPLNESTTGLYEEQTFTNSPGRRKRNADFITSPASFTPSVSKRPSDSTTAGITNNPHATAEPMPSAHTSLTYTATKEFYSMASDSTDTPTSHSPTHAYSVTSAPPVTHPSWLTQQSRTDMTSESISTAYHSINTRDTSVTEHYTSYVTGSGITASVTVKEEMLDVLSEEMSYLVSDLNPFTEYKFRVSAFTTVGEGPAADIMEKTREQVPSAVLNVTYQNISSTSILVSWVPPVNPNGRITHYTIYGLKVHNSQEQQWESNGTALLITDLEKYTAYKLGVAASTAVGESELTDEEYIYVYTEEDVPDSPPTNLTVVDTSPSTATLSWSPPEQANGVIQYYQVHYGNDTFEMSINTTTHSATLMDLKPFSFYNVSVRAFTRLGHGNQRSDSLHLLSGEDVPGGPPNNLSYESVSPSEVNVTWLPPELPNGNITHYGLELWNSTHFLNLTSSTQHLLIQYLKKYTEYRLRVQAYTRVGPGNFTQPINITTLEDAPDTPPQFLRARKLSDYEVELSWEAPQEANSDILYYKVRVWNETTEQWQNVTKTSVVINVDSESPYNASVSSWTRLEPFDPPHNVTTANMTFSSVTLTWLPPREPNGIIVHYSIYYRDNYTVTEQKVYTKEVSTSPDVVMSYTLTGLIGGTNYTVWMTSSTIQGDGGVQTEPMTVLLPEGVPSDSVHNLTATNATAQAILVTWDPPLEPNGRLHYLLTLQEAALPPNTSNQGRPYKIIRQTTTDTVFLFTKLRIYFPYVFNVTPATAAGIAYNHTRTLHLRTRDDVPSSPPVLLSTRNLSSSSIAVVWQRPLEANGEITEYTLTLSGPGGTNTTFTTETSYELTNLLPYTAYNLSITAATRKGNGPALMLHLHTDEGGPMSPPYNLTIYNHTAVSVWLSWEPALEPNGVVTHYGFRIRELITQTVTLQNSSGPSTMEHLSGFRPHSSYEISVCSYTRVGHGNQFSSPVTFTTNESVSDTVKNLLCTGVSWDSVQLWWERPDNPNGQILFYEITVEVNAERLLHQAHTANYSVSGLSPEQDYILTVAAVNSAGPGDAVNCTASTLSESVPAAPLSLIISGATANNMTLEWSPPLTVPGLLRQYQIIAQLLSRVCESSPAIIDHIQDCVDDSFVLSLNVTNGTTDKSSFTVQALSKYRSYRFRVAAVTSAGVGEYTAWVYGRTLAGDPDAPPRDLRVTATANSLHVMWEEPAVLSGPTKYLIRVEGPGVNLSLVLGPGEQNSLLVSNLTAFSTYDVTVIAFTGTVQSAATDGKAVGPLVFHTLEEEPKSPPTNVTVTVIPDEVNQVMVSFSPPEEPNGNITAYYVYIYQGQEMVRNISLTAIQSEENQLTAVIDGLKGGHNYTIQISARNGAGKSPPSPHVKITTAIKAPAKPTQIPQAMLGHRGVAMVTHRSIAIHMPACFYSDDNGPIARIQVIVAESGVKDTENVTNWRAAFSRSPAPYITDRGFPNPTCEDPNPDPDPAPDQRIGQHLLWGDKPPLVLPNMTGVYVIGQRDDCLNESDTYCNGPLKPNTVYVFKFRATNIKGEYTDSEYSEHIKTNANGLLTREEQIILGVLLSFFLAVLLIIIICCSVKLHQHKKEGGTYSPREAEIIETKCKLDQLIAIADMELKQEKINRYSSFFFRRKEIYVIQLLSYRKSLKPVNKKSFLQHVEDLCSNDNAKFQEEFSALPKLLQDLATTDADMPCNRTKNRFPNIKPYNNNRVKLLSQPGSDGSDYINASFVSGYLCPNEFIATQGPLPGTVAAFWRMIWETGTRTIVMLTQCFEKGRIRCHKYWPEDDKPMSVFSDILVSKVSEEVFPDWTVRTLRVERHGHYILVRHFNYTSWPEHGVPESCTTLIKFVRAVRTHRLETSTIVVHCSAGVGRTGVFIALDHLIQHVRDHDFVDIYGLVAELRSERMCMVQNLAQYIFLHQSTLELLNSKGNSQSIWFVSYSALEKTDSLEGMEGDVELEWEETTM